MTAPLPNLSAGLLNPPLAPPDEQPTSGPGTGAQVTSNIDAQARAAAATAQLAAEAAQATANQAASAVQQIGTGGGGGGGAPVTAQSIETALGFTPVSAAGAAAAAPVQSVNGGTGAVTVAGGGGGITTQQAAAAAPVQSVNGQIGTVNLTIPPAPGIAASGTPGLIAPSSDIVVAPGTGVATVNAPTIGAASGTLNTARMMLLDDGTAGSAQQIATLLNPYIQGGGGSPPASSLTMGASSGTAGGSQSFTYDTTASTPYFGWAAAGTTVGAASPTLTGSAVSVASSTSGSGAATIPAAGSYVPVLMSGSTGPVIAVGATYTSAASNAAPALALASGTAFGTVGGRVGMTAGAASFPATLLPSTPGSPIVYIALDFYAVLGSFVSGTEGLNLIAGQNFALYVDSATGTLDYYNTTSSGYSGGNFSHVAGNPNIAGNSTWHRVVLALGGNVNNIYLDGSLLFSVAGATLPPQSGSIYIGAQGDGTQSILAGNCIANVVIAARDPGGSGFTFSAPPYTDGNTPGLEYYWPLSANGSGNT